MNTPDPAPEPTPPSSNPADSGSNPSAADGNGASPKLRRPLSTVNKVTLGFVIGLGAVFASVLPYAQHRQEQLRQRNAAQAAERRAERVAEGLRRNEQMYQSAMGGYGSPGSKDCPWDGKPR